MLKYHKLPKGFTIVELLIVVVVIAILAAITIVAYNGIQNRAAVSKKAAEVNGYFKSQNLFIVTNSRSSKFDNATDKQALNLGGLVNRISYTTDIFTLNGCRSLPMDKTRYCLVNNQGLIWWDDTKKSWVITYDPIYGKPTSQATEPNYGGTLITSDKWPASYVTSNDYTQETTNQDSLGAGAFPNPATNGAQ